MMSLWSTRNRLQRQDRDVQIARVGRGDFVVAISGATGRRYSSSELGALRSKHSQRLRCSIIDVDNGQQHSNLAGFEPSMFAMTLPMRL